MTNKISKIVILIIGLISIIYIFFTPHIILNGPNILNLEVNSKYQEEGISIYSLKKYKLRIKNNVNTNKIGKYKIEYIVNDKYKIIRKVIVKDSIPPNIKIKGNKNTNICSFGTYIDEGIIATDNYDGDITKNVKIKEEKNKIKYIAKDSSGNESKATRNLIVKDATKPIINLNGNNYMYVNLGEKYEEQGAEAIDNCDGNISSKIKITGEVNTNELGEYKIKYEVTDSSNNKSQTERTVKVISNDKIIYLTFDDGPSHSITSKLLDILKEENVKATFFVINHGDDLNYLIKREYDEGHTVAIHSYTHNYDQIYTSVDAYFKDLEAMKNKIKNITGINSNIIRFPGGSSNTISRFNPGIMTTLTQEVINRGYVYFDWNVSSGDAGGASNSLDVYNNVINNLNSKSNIVLLHDFESNYKTLEAIKNIIKTAKSQGYQFKSLDVNSPIIRHKVNN